MKQSVQTMEGQAIFLRAWYYFCMTRSFGGMPIVGDQIFTYEVWYGSYPTSDTTFNRSRCLSICNRSV